MINNELFKLKEIPNYHPIVDKYERTDFWREEKRKCIEGYWVGGYWMPLNFITMSTFTILLWRKVSIGGFIFHGIGI